MMGFEKKIVELPSDEEIAIRLGKPKASNTVRMKYIGHFRGLEKVVELPIPLISKSQKLDETLSFKRASDKQGPGFCDVPIEWAGALMDVGGNWQLVDALVSPERMAEIRSAQAVCTARMDKFALENELVEA